MKNKKKDVLFICTGNTCRSPMAEAYFNFLCKQADDNKMHVHSAGIFASPGTPASSNSISTLRNYDIELNSHQSSLATVDKLNQADYIICMTAGHREQILAIAPEAAQKISLLLDHLTTGNGSDVADPFGGDLQVYTSCFEEMKPALDNLFLDLIS